VTVQDANLIMYEWFSKSNSFTEKELIKILKISESPDEDKAAIMASLVEFEKNGWVKKVLFGNKNYWILNKPFTAFEQSVAVSAPTAQAIAEMINKTCEILNLEKEKCDPTNLTDKDLRNLVSICWNLSEKKTEEES
jgi:hypothetical protein